MLALRTAALAAMTVAFLFAFVPVSQSAELQVFELELNESPQSLADRLVGARAQHERLGTGGVVRGFIATIAGQDTGRIVVIVEYESAEARRAGQALIEADPETAELVAARQAAGNSLIGNTRWVELLPSDDGGM